MQELTTEDEQALEVFQSSMECANDLPNELRPAFLRSLARIHRIAANMIDARVAVLERRNQ